MSVRPCAKVMYTKTQERIKIIECGFFFGRCILRIETFDPNARRLTKLEPNEIFNDFAISPFDEIDSKFFYFKDMNWKIPPDPSGRFPKLKPNECSSSHILVLKLKKFESISSNGSRDIAKSL